MLLVGYGLFLLGLSVFGRCGTDVDIEGGANRSGLKGGGGSHYLDILDLV